MLHAYDKLLVTTAALACLVATGAAQAAATNVVNKSGLPIDGLAVSAPGTGKWGVNLIEGAKEGALDSGKSLKVKGLVDGTYDFQIAAPDEGVLCTMKNVVVKKNAVTLDEAMGKACK